jgi:acetyltransferase-like isoleucine patch superfamily enzyme
MRQLTRRAFFRSKGYHIGRNVHFGRNVTLAGEQVFIGDDCYFDDGVTITSPVIKIGRNSIFFSDIDIFALRSFKIGPRCKISRNCVLKANRIEVGHDLWCNEYVEIGGGGWQSPTANITIGDFTHIGKNAHLNVCKAIDIDGYCGIGMDCMLFTHSSGNGQSVLAGYSSVEAGIHVGLNVSLYSRVIVAPGTTIEDGVTVAAGSYVRGVLERDGFYAGSPAKLKSKVVHPSAEEKYRIMKHILVPLEEFSDGYTCRQKDTWVIVVKELSAAARSYIHNADIPSDHIFCVVCLEDEAQIDFYGTYINLGANTISGQTGDGTEQIRDALRREGIILDFHNYTPKKLDATSLKEKRIEL